MNPQHAPKGGPVARQAAMLCQDPAFRLYLDRRRRYKYGMTESQLPDGTHNEQDARDWLVAACGIQSRAELDHDRRAGGIFKGIRQRYHHWRIQFQQQEPANAEKYRQDPGVLPNKASNRGRA